MLEAPNVSTDYIVECLQASYGLMPQAVEFMPVGADVDSAAFRIEVGNRSLFLKLRRNLSHEALHLARFLATKASPLVLSPLPTPSGALAVPVGEWSVVLYPFLEGTSAFDTDLMADQWESLGSALRAVHDSDPPAELRGAVRVDSYSPKWRSIVKQHLTFAVEGRDPYARRLLESLNERRSHIVVIVERAEDLAARVKAKSLPSVLCHGDIHGGNVIVGRNSSITIIDWDDPLVAPRERDLMFIGAGVGGTWNKDEESEAFYRGYGPIDVDREAIAYYRYERIVEDIALFCDFLLKSGGGGEDRALALHYFDGSFGPNDVVAIADSTYESLH